MKLIETMSKEEGEKCLCVSPNLSPTWSCEAYICERMRHLYSSVLLKFSGRWLEDKSLISSLSSLPISIQGLKILEHQDRKRR